jgi:xanthine dehydrogenase small subunit
VIQYLHRNQLISETDLPADLTLLDYLRTRRQLTATKEGCASGDCGACTVALGQLNSDGELVYQSVNSCICPATELQGCDLVTAADLQSEESLHPVQRAFVESHASQCGFCTPGFVVSAFTLLEGRSANAPLTDEEASQAVAGNLCRCTGYGPIISAVKAAAEGYETRLERAAVAESLRGINNCASENELKLPTTLEDLGALLLQHPDAELIAGGTDLMLEVTQRLRAKPRMIGLSRISELQHIEQQGRNVRVGAGVTFNQLHSWASAEVPELARLLLHIGSDQIRNRGTVGGNLGTASPIGDLPPVLLALDASVTLWSQRGVRELPLDQFFTGYRMTQLGGGEIIHSVSFKLPSSHERFVIEKVSKRREDDISALLLCARFTLNEGRIETIDLGLGGVAATPLRAAELCASLAATQITAWDYAKLRLLFDQHIQPLDDLRASADYRLHCATVLLLEAIQRSEVVDAN